MRQIDIPRIYETTGLGRPVDPSVASNRVALAGSALAGAISLLLSWLGNDELAVLAAISVAAGVFLSWALVREIDPDNDPASYLAMVFAGIAGLIAAPAALVVGVLLLAVRVFSGTVGSELRPLDLVVLTAAAGFAGTQPVAWPIVGLLAYAVVRSGHRQAKAVAIGMSVTAATTALLFVSDLGPGVPGVATWVLLLVLGVVGWNRIRNPQVESFADNGAPLRSPNVGVARLATLTAVAAGAVLAPEAALSHLSPAVAAFVAMMLWPRRIPVPEESVDEPVAVLDPTAPIAVGR